MRTATLLLASTLFVGSVQAGPQLRIVNPATGQSKRGSIEEASISVRPHGIYLEVGLYLTFSAWGSSFPATADLEVAYFFDLPEGAMVTDSWLWVGDDIMQALILDRWTASSIYENIVNRRRDPSILFKRNETRYELRVYPMRGSETRRVKITYLVPAGFVGNKATLPLPLDLLTDSYVPIPHVDVIAWPDPFTGVPSITESLVAATFMADSDSILGPFYRLRLDRTTIDASPTVTVAMPLTFQDGIHLSALDDGGSGYYQLVVDPASFLSQSKPRKVLVLVDHDRLTSSLDREAVMDRIKTGLKGYLSASDQFNLIVSKIDARAYSNAWVPAHPDSIDRAFSTVGLPAEYSVLPTLLRAGVDFIKGNGNTGTVVLLSSSDQFQDHGLANDLLDDIGIGVFGGAIGIVDYQDLSIDEFRLNGIWYRGNGYLYTNLARVSGGEYVALSTAQISFESAVRSAILSAGGKLSSVDVYTDLSAGFTFARETSDAAYTGYNMDYPITQTGRFVGLPPWEVTFSGIYDGDAFSVSTLLSNSVIAAADSTIKTAWAGRRIQILEASLQTNATISEIVRLSQSYRVLSEYTAFLALEPSDTTKACANCVDEAQALAIQPDELPSTDSLMMVYPNPFTGSATIELSLPPEIDDGSATLSVYDVMGRAVRRFEIPMGGGGVRRLSWDGTSSDNRPVARGVYFVTLSTRRGSRTVQVVRL